MKSRAHFRGHPIHAMLVAFPIAFVVGTPLFDSLGLLLDWPGGGSTGAYLSIAAIASGLIAAVPGVIDYLSIIPPKSSAKTRATQHMLVNSAALLLFALAWLFRDATTLRPGLAALLLEFTGVGLMTVGGWLGGTLVFRNQIGVDHRYAHAGKWLESAHEPGDGPIVVGKVDDLKDGQMKLLHVGDRRLVLARTDRGYTVFDDRCTHKGASLADGALVCGVVQCPWHGSQFDAHDGSVKAGPSNSDQPIATHRVEVVDGEIRLFL